MTEIAPEPDAITLINVFTVEPQNQQPLVDLLRHATVAVMAKQSGYISARIYRGLDGTRVAVYAQWRSREDFQGLAANPDAAAHMRRARALASFEPVLYDVVFTHRTTDARVDDGAALASFNRCLDAAHEDLGRG